MCLIYIPKHFFVHDLTIIIIIPSNLIHWIRVSRLDVVGGAFIRLNSVAVAFVQHMFLQGGLQGERSIAYQAAELTLVMIEVDVGFDCDLICVSTWAVIALEYLSRFFYRLVSGNNYLIVLSIGVITVIEGWQNSQVVSFLRISCFVLEFNFVAVPLGLISFDLIDDFVLSFLK